MEGQPQKSSELKNSGFWAFKSFSIFSIFSKLSCLTQDEEHSAKFAKNEQIELDDNGKSFPQVVKNRRVYSCLIAKFAKNAKNAKFGGGDQKECDLKENIKDLPFNSC